MRVSSSGSVRRLAGAAAAGLLAATACRDSTTPSPPLAGAFALITVDGEPLPITTEFDGGAPGSYNRLVSLRIEVLADEAVRQTTRSEYVERRSATESVVHDLGLSPTDGHFEQAATRVILRYPVPGGLGWADTATLNADGTRLSFFRTHHASVGGGRHRYILERVD